MTIAAKQQAQAVGCGKCPPPYECVSDIPRPETLSTYSDGKYPPAYPMISKITNPKPVANNCECQCE